MINEKETKEAVQHIGTILNAFRPEDACFIMTDLFGDIIIKLDLLGKLGDKENSIVSKKGMIAVKGGLLILSAKINEIENDFTTAEMIYKIDEIKKLTLARMAEITD